MSTRDRLRELLTCDESSFPSAARSFLAAHDGAPGRVAEAEADLAELLDLPSAAVATLSAHERNLCRRMWVLDRAPLGITLAGPVYQDNPVVYVNETFRALTGYSLSTVRGENLRLLQGPDSESEAGLIPGILPLVVRPDQQRPRRGRAHDARVVRDDEGEVDPDT